MLSLPDKLDPEGLLVGRVYTLRDFFFFFFGSNDDGFLWIHPHALASGVSSWKLMQDANLS